MRKLLLLLIPFPALAVISDVRVSGTTATQAIMAYTAPGDQACTIQVSESPNYIPLVHDVDESLFPGSSSDSREGSLVDGPMRVVVVGKHGMTAAAASNPFRGSDGNRYSRALQANTLHYYRITCGSDMVTGKFTTGNIELGSTYPEPLAMDATTPGTYNWPSTVSAADRTESWVDPNTGSLIRKITMAADTDGTLGAFGWPSGGMFQLCSHLTAQSSAHTYNLCYVPNVSALLVSIELDTGNVYPLTRMGIAYGGVCSNNSWQPVTGVHFSPTDPTAFWFTSGCDSLPSGGGVGSVVWSGKWTGSLNVAASQSSLHWPPKWQAGLTATLLTPTGLLGMLGAFDARFTSTYRTNLPNLGVAGTQNGHLLFSLVSQQDSLGWIFVFNPGNNQPIGSGGTGGVIASNPFWLAPVSRWCSMHTLMPGGDNNPWIAVTSNSPGRYGDGGYMGSAYTVTVAKDAGTGDVIQIAPAPTNGSYEPQSTSTPPSYVQDAQVGDLFWVNAMGPYGTEPVEIVSKDAVNHTWTVIRGNNLGQSLFINGSDITPNSVNPVNITTGMKLYAGCRGTSFASRIGWLSALWYWNYVNDPYGRSIAYPAVNGTTSNQVVENFETGGHEVTRDSVNVMEAWVRWNYPNSTPGYDLATGFVRLNNSPLFAGITVANSGSGNGNQLHPSYEPVSGSMPAWFVDALPFTNGNGAGTPYRGTATLVGGTTSTYQMSGVSLNRKQLTTFGSCGTHPLVDISSTATGNVISDATPYTYCVANAAGECRPGSAAGQAFVSCPGVTQLSCNSNTISTQVDICLGDSFAYSNAAVQVSAATTEPNGGSGRVITNLFGTHHAQWVYDNVRPTADGGWMLFQNSNSTGSLQAYMAKMPPLPAAEATRRDTFVPVTLRFASYSGANNAIVEFGYAENGAPGSFYCTSRKEACVAQTYGVNQSRPFYYLTTDASSITGMPLACGAPSQPVLGMPRPRYCMITIPALPGRVLYYRVFYRDAAGRVLRQQATAAVAVP